MKFYQKGLSLVELMVSLFVAVALLMASVAIFTSNAQIGAEQMQRDFLRSEMNRLITLMSSEISRAGYCFDCQAINPFISDVNGQKSSVLLGSHNPAVAVQDTCIRFAYNTSNESGVLSIDDDDAKGFRFSPKDNAIEIYENYSGLNNWHCDKGYWKDLTHENLVVKTLHFIRTTYTTTSTHRVQQVQISLDLALASDPAISDQMIKVLTLPNVDY